MFTTLFNSVFVGLGEAFGYISAFASMPWSSFLTLLEIGTVPVYYSNLFTGELITSLSFPFGFIGELLSFIARLATPLNLYSAPTFLVMLYHSFGVFILVAMFKFLKDLLF